MTLSSAVQPDESMIVSLPGSLSPRTRTAKTMVEGIVGATDLGDGRVVLILNLPALARMAQPDPGGVDLATRTRSA